ncbi:hypothetical protein BH23PLA1_BH23PLA1_24150 [soil metagenome]
MKTLATPDHRHRGRPRGFTLIELLVVISIILLLSVAVLPTVFAVLAQQDMTNAVQLVQSTLAGVRDTAIRAGQARGVRLLLDPSLSDLPRPGFPEERVAANRMVFLEPAPNYSEGMVTANEWRPYPNLPLKLLTIMEQQFDSNGLPMPPTSWYYNIRQGDKIRLGGSGHEYTIVGPMHRFIRPLEDFHPNYGAAPQSRFTPERFVNLGDNFYSRPTDPPEFLIVLNGRDDRNLNGTRDGYVDEAFDGINNDGVGQADPGFLINPIDMSVVSTLDMMLNNSGGEYEVEEFIGSVPFNTGQAIPYTIIRRPMVSRDSREIALPGSVVIDLTTTSSFTAAQFQERSRVPMDPLTGFVDIMIYPNGQVLPSTPYGNYDELTRFPFYHLWLTKREDVVEPIDQNPNLPGLEYPSLPLPQGAPGWQGGPNLDRFLRTDRRLITISTRTGLTSVNQLSEDVFTGSESPYQEAQQGRSSP